MPMLIQTDADSVDKLMLMWTPNICRGGCGCLYADVCSDAQGRTDQAGEPWAISHYRESTDRVYTDDCIRLQQPARMSGKNRTRDSNKRETHDSNKNFKSNKNTNKNAIIKSEHKTHMRGETLQRNTNTNENTCKMIRRARGKRMIDFVSYSLKPN